MLTVSDCPVLNNRIAGRDSSWLTDVMSWHFLQGTEEKLENISENSWYPSQHSD